MKISILSTIALCFFCLCACTQTSPKSISPKCEDAAFDKEVRRYLDFSIPVLSVHELAENKDKFIILDARESEEFNTSHLEHAIHIGYKDLNSSVLDTLDKNKAILLYCSIGYRSEKVAEKLKKQGFNNVSNLYGSIFEWVNQGNPVVNDKGLEVSIVHGYNKKWSKWVLNPSIKTVY